MRKKIVIGLCLISVIIGMAVLTGLLPLSGSNQRTVNNGSLSGQPQNAFGEVLGGQSSSNVVLNTVITKVPDQVMVYKTLPTIVTKADAIEFAKKFNITDINEPKEGDAVISVSSKDMRYNVMLYKNGGSRYSDYHRIDNPNGIDIAENLPSDAEAERIATTFLKERNLMPEGAEFGGSEHRTAIGHFSNGTKKVSWEDILLGYTREINGLKVEGTQFIVEVGAHGDIISFFANWKEYQPAGEYPIKSGESAFAELQQKGITTGTMKPDTVSIEKVYLAYHTKALAYHENYLEPVWVFQGNVLVDGKSVEPIQEFIPALTDDAVKSLSL